MARVAWISKKVCISLSREDRDWKDKREIPEPKEIKYINCCYYPLSDDMFMYSLINEQQCFIRPDKTRAASLLNGFKNEPLEAVRIPLYKDHNLYIKNTNKIYCRPA